MFKITIDVVLVCVFCVYGITFMTLHVYTNINAYLYLYAISYIAEYCIVFTPFNWFKKLQTLK